MLNLKKYMDVLKRTYDGNSRVVHNSVNLLFIGMLAGQGVSKPYIVSKEVWEALGKPPAKHMAETAYTYESYSIDLGDPRALGVMLAAAAHNAIQAGCFAATDITDAINAINNDNMDGVLSDRNAMIAVSQVMQQGMQAFQGLKDESDRELREKMSGVRAF